MAGPSSTIKTANPISAESANRTPSAKYPNRIMCFSLVLNLFADSQLSPLMSLMAVEMAIAPATIPKSTKARSRIIIPKSYPGRLGDGSSKNYAHGWRGRPTDKEKLPILARRQIPGVYPWVCLALCGVILTADRREFVSVLVYDVLHSLF